MARRANVDREACSAARRRWHPIGGVRTQMVDWFKLHRQNALRYDAYYAAGISAITNYDGAGLTSR